MSAKQIYFMFFMVGLSAAAIFLITSSPRRAFDDLSVVENHKRQLLVIAAKTNQPTSKKLTSPQVSAPAPEIASFEMIEKKYAEISPEQARQEVRHIDEEARQNLLKKFDDFSDQERTTFLSRQREKVVLLNKIILAKLERVRK